MHELVVQHGVKFASHLILLQELPFATLAVAMTQWHWQQVAHLLSISMGAVH